MPLSFVFRSSSSEWYRSICARIIDSERSDHEQRCADSSAKVAASSLTTADCPRVVSFCFEVSTRSSGISLQARRYGQKNALSHALVQEVDVHKVVVMFVAFASLGVSNQDARFTWRRFRIESIEFISLCPAIHERDAANDLDFFRGEVDAAPFIAIVQREDYVQVQVRFGFVFLVGARIGAELVSVPRRPRKGDIFNLFILRFMYYFILYYYIYIHIVWYIADLY